MIVYQVMGSVQVLALQMGFKYPFEALRDHQLILKLSPEDKGLLLNSCMTTNKMIMDPKGSRDFDIQKIDSFEYGPLKLSFKIVEVAPGKSCVQIDDKEICLNTPSEFQL